VNCTTPPRNCCTISARLFRTAKKSFAPAWVNLGKKGVAARAKLSAALDSAKETARKLQSKTVAGAKATDKVIREHPYQSIGIAFGVGLLIGVLVNRK